MNTTHRTRCSILKPPRRQNAKRELGGGTRQTRRTRNGSHAHWELVTFGPKGFGPSAMRADHARATTSLRATHDADYQLYRERGDRDTVFRMYAALAFEAACGDHGWSPSVTGPRLSPLVSLSVPTL